MPPLLRISGYEVSSGNDRLQSSATVGFCEFHFRFQQSDCHLSDSPAVHYKTDTALRTVLEVHRDCTIAAERGVTLKTEELNELLEDMKATIQPGDYLIFSGDASNSPDPSVYNKILEMFRDRDLKFFLDTSGKSLKECIRETPYMIKPNLDELSTLAGHPIAEDDASIVEAIESLDSYNVPIIAVSLGGDGSIVKAPEGYYRVHPPKVNVQNTIGCGDCFLSGFVYGLSEGYSIEDTIRIATAVSAATAESKLSAGYDLERAKELKEQVTIEKIK